MIVRILKAAEQIKYMLFGKPFTIHHRHDTYHSYVEKQKEKTNDPERVKKWLGDEWEEKLDGFRNLFNRNLQYVKPANNCICLGARTGQEVAALRELNKTAIGIDLVEFQPYTIQGDIHNLDFREGEFDLVFSNIFDHSLYPDKFIAEMERVCAIDGFIIINLQLYTKGDEYSENIINDPEEVIKLFSSSTVIVSRKIINTFDAMNWEIVMRKY